MLLRIYLFMVCLLGTGILSHAQEKTPPPPPPPATTKKPSPPVSKEGKPAIPVEVTAFKKAKTPPPPPPVKTSPGRPKGAPKVPPPPVKGKVKTPEQPVSQ